MGRLRRKWIYIDVYKRNEVYLLFIWVYLLTKNNADLQQIIEFDRTPRVTVGYAESAAASIELRYR